MMCRRKECVIQEEEDVKSCMNLLGRLSEEKTTPYSINVWEWEENKGETGRKEILSLPPPIIFFCPFAKK